MKPRIEDRQQNHRPAHSLQRMPSFTRKTASFSACCPRRLIIVQFLVTCLFLVTSVRCQESRDEIASGTIVVSDADTDRKIVQETTHALFGARTPSSSSHRQSKSLNLDQDLESAASSQSLVSKDSDPLQSILPKVTFVCKGLREGYYADTDFDCEVFHYCKTNGFRFTFVCPTGSKFNQRQMTCDYEAKDSICTDVARKRKDSSSDPMSPSMSSATTTTTAASATLATTGTTYSPESSEAHSEATGGEDGKLSHSVIASVPQVDEWMSFREEETKKKETRLNSLWPHFDSQSQESHARPVIHDSMSHDWKNSESSVPRPDGHPMTTSGSSSKSYFQEPNVLYLNASNVDASDFSASQMEEDVHRTQAVYQFTGTSVSDRYVSPQNTPKSLIRNTTPMPSIDPQPVYQPESSSTTTTTTTTSPPTTGTSTSSGPTTEPSFFGSPSDERRSSVKPPYGYRNPYSFKPLPTTPKSSDRQNNNSTNSSETTTTTTTTTRSPIQIVLQEILMAATATPPPPVTSSTPSTSSPDPTIGSFTWNQEMTGSGFKPVKQGMFPKKYQPQDYKRIKESSGLIFQNIPSHQQQSFLKFSPSSSQDTSFEAVFPDSSLSAARLHELLTGASHAALMAGSHSESSLHHLLSGDEGSMGGASLQNPFPTQPLMLESLQETSMPGDHRHLHPSSFHPMQHHPLLSSGSGSGSHSVNLSIPASSLIPPSPSPPASSSSSPPSDQQNLVYETVTISHSGVNPFHAHSAGDSLSGVKNLLLEQSSPANPAFLTGFRQYHTPHFASLSTLNHQRPNFQFKHPVQQSTLPFGLMTHLLPGTTVQRLPPSIPLSGSSAAASFKYSMAKDVDPGHKSSYLYLNRPPAMNPQPDSNVSSVMLSGHTGRPSVITSQGMMEEFQQLPQSVQHMIAKQLGLTPPKTVSHKFPFPVLSQSLDETSEETAYKTKGRIFGLPKLKPMTLNGGMDQPPPNHNFHTQNPNLLPNAMLVSASNVNPISKPNRPQNQVNHQPPPQGPQSAISTSSIMTEINNLLKQNIFTRPRTTLSLRPPAGFDKHGVPILKMASNPFTSWLKPSAGGNSNNNNQQQENQMQPQITDHSGIPFAMMASGSQSSYPSFADPPNFMQSPNTRPKRKFFFSRPFFPFSRR